MDMLWHFSVGALAQTKLVFCFMLLSLAALSYAVKINANFYGLFDVEKVIAFNAGILLEHCTFPTPVRPHLTL